MAAKQNGRRTFPVLLDRVARIDVLGDAWEQVRRNRGAAGIDGETLEAVEAYGVGQMLAELRGRLQTGRYRPQPMRRVHIPRPGPPGESRPLFIPRVRDRVAQTAAKLVLERAAQGAVVPAGESPAGADCPVGAAVIPGARRRRLAGRKPRSRSLGGRHGIPGRSVQEASSPPGRSESEPIEPRNQPHPGLQLREASADGGIGSAEPVLKGPRLSPLGKNFLSNSSSKDKPPAFAGGS